MGAVFLIPFKIYIHSTSVYHKPRKFVSCETEELSYTRQAKWMFKKGLGGGDRGREERERIWP